MVFYPPKRSGTTFHLGVLLIMVALVIWGVWRAIQASIGPEFLLALIPLIVGGGLTPFITYRAYALLRAYYILDRDGIRLHWGLRSEKIPINTITWIRPAKDLGQPLLRPFLSWPGSLLGVRHQKNFGSVEYLASNSETLILIGTGDRIFAFSPEDPIEFMNAYQRVSEHGSITPWEAESLYPGFLLARVWRSFIARFLILGGLLLNLILLAWVSLVAPQRTQIQLGFATTGETVPGMQLLLLPILSISFFLLDLLFGLYFFRANANQTQTSVTETGSHNNENLILAYLTWGSGLLTPALFLVAVFYILKAG